jgi:hypothetical protein
MEKEMLLILDIISITQVRGGGVYDVGVLHRSRGDSKLPPTS